MSLSDRGLHKYIQFCVPRMLLAILSVLACFQKRHFLTLEGLRQLLSNVTHPSGPNTNAVLETHTDVLEREQLNAFF